MAERTPGSTDRSDHRGPATSEPLGPEAFALAARAPGALVVDVREAEEVRREGRLPGALPIPRGCLELALDPHDHRHRPELRAAQRLLVACSDGRRAGLAAATLAQLGFRGVAHLEGGLEAWREAGLDLHDAVVVMSQDDYRAIAGTT